jgi:hypothetical protein
MRASHASLKEGATRMQLNSNDNPESSSEEVGSTFVSELLERSNNNDSSILKSKYSPTNNSHFSCPGVTNTSTELDETFKDLECFTVNFTRYNDPTTKR